MAYEYAAPAASLPLLASPPHTITRMPLPSPSAAGNGGYNNDAKPSYPASFKFKGNVAVANINSGTVIDTSR